YDVSHIPGAQWVGYKSFSLDRIKTAFSRTDTSIVVYCSVGVRSENIGEKFLDMGYTEVNNLYGGIFEWKNKGYIVVDSTGNETQNVHAYSKYWGNLLTDANRVY
ncbi:MAG: rhodanese-like domain-containing protein, partial [Flavobacteriaceae bacterium]